MPELPEVETARRLIADKALHRRIVDVDDSDTFVCRPHSPGELRAALAGRTLTEAYRRGKAMWCETSEGGPDLGIHLGMGGRIVVTSKDGQVAEGGEPWRRRLSVRAAGDTLACQRISSASRFPTPAILDWSSSRALTATDPLVISSRNSAGVTSAATGPSASMSGTSRTRPRRR